MLNMTKVECKVQHIILYYSTTYHLMFHYLDNYSKVISSFFSFLNSCFKYHYFMYNRKVRYYTSIALLLIMP